MYARSALFAVILTAASQSQAADNSANRNQILEEINQTRTGDYSYQVTREGRRVPRSYGFDRQRSSFQDGWTASEKPLPRRRRRY